MMDEAPDHHIGLLVEAEWRDGRRTSIWTWPEVFTPNLPNLLWPPDNARSRTYYRRLFEEANAERFDLVDPLLRWHLNRLNEITPANQQATKVMLSVDAWPMPPFEKSEQLLQIGNDSSGQIPNRRRWLARTIPNDFTAD
jgi:hypothetical protein